MLNFAAAIDAVCKHLEGRGFVVTKRGEGVPNIEANKNGRNILVKTTGQTNPDGDPFTDSQVKAHVERIVYDATTLIEKKTPTAEVWIAVPADAGHTRRVLAIIASLRRLGIGVLWIDEDGSVSPFG